jgi:hypothetical protein
MKRSQMIQKLADLLEPVIYDRFNAHIEAEYILMKLEEEGILPPLTYFSTLKVQDNGWEPEDDK